MSEEMHVEFRAPRLEVNGSTPGASVSPGEQIARGADGVSPVIAVEDIEGGHRVTITSAGGTVSFDVLDGDTGPQGPAGDDYVLTAADKAEIAGMVDVPDELADLADDATHRLVTDAEKTVWSGKLDPAGTAHRAGGVHKGQVDATSTSTVFTAQIEGITEYYDGLTVYLTNGVVTSASGFTLDINSLGAKPCYSSMAAASRATTIFNIAYSFVFVYNANRVEGGCWDIQYGYDSNTNTIGYQLRSNSLSLPATDKFYRYRLLFASSDGEHFVPANISSNTGATAARTPNTRAINPFGRIVYYGTTAAVDAGSRPGATYLWSQYVVTIGYSFTASNLTSWKPVYVKAAPQADGSAIIDATTPFVQELPSVEDGKIYIFLGIAVSATTLELLPEHPVYCFRAGRLQLWTGVQTELDALAARIAALES